LQNPAAERAAELAVRAGARKTGCFFFWKKKTRGAGRVWE
jgi:hypothetical protein